MKKCGKYKQNTIYYKGDDQSITLCWENHKVTCPYKQERVADIDLHVEQLINVEQTIKATKQTPFTLKGSNSISRQRSKQVVHAR